MAADDMPAFCPEGATPAGYIDWAVDQARRMLGVELVVEGEGEDARGLVCGGDARGWVGD